MGVPTYTLPVAGGDTSAEEPKIITALSELKTLLTGGLDTSNIASGTFSDNDLSYRTLLSAGELLPGSTPVGTYLMQGTGVTLSGTISQPSLPFFYFDDADYAVSGKSLRLRVRAQLLTNATACGLTTLVVGLYRVTASGGASGPVLTLSSVIGGSTVSFATPAALSVLQANSGDFSAPADGVYVFAFATTGATSTAGSDLRVGAQLQMHHI